MLLFWKERFKTAFLQPTSMKTTEKTEDNEGDDEDV